MDTSITEITFHLPFQTNFGENLYVVGNLPVFGSWNPRESRYLCISNTLSLSILSIFSSHFNEYHSAYYQFLSLYPFDPFLLLAPLHHLSTPFCSIFARRMIYKHPSSWYLRAEVKIEDKPIDLRYKYCVLNDNENGGGIPRWEPGEEHTVKITGMGKTEQKDVWGV